MISEKQYNVAIGKVTCGHLPPEEAIDFIEVISQMEAMLDEADGDDYFGTEGWRHRLGWD